MNINGAPINPVSREYPRNFIPNGNFLYRCINDANPRAKTPDFFRFRMNHNELAVQIARQAVNFWDDDSRFAVVFAAMGVKNDVAEYFRRSFDESGSLQRVVMFPNLSNDPIIERTLTPRCALTAAEYLAYELGMHVLVIMTDMTSYAEALREFSSY